MLVAPQNCGQNLTSNKLRKAARLRRKINSLKKELAQIFGVPGK
jgi:hypothetical protein